MSTLQDKLQAAKNSAIAAISSTPEAEKLALELPSEDEEAPPEEDFEDGNGDEVAEPVETPLTEILARVQAASSLPEWTPPKGAFKVGKLKQLVLANRTVRPNEYGYYVVEEGDAEVLKNLDYFADLNYGYVERV